jgi:hypothetical protein
LSTKSFNAGCRVAFQLGDAVCPEFEQIIAQTGPDLTVAGEIVMFSDRGTEAEHFAIVQVTGIHAPLIVPVERLHSGATAEAAVHAEEDETPRPH